MPKATQRAGVGFAFLALGLVVDARPFAHRQCAGAPEVNGMAQVRAAGPPQFDDVHLPALVADRRSPGVALQSLRGVEALAVLADLAEQAGREFVAGARQ